MSKFFHEAAATTARQGYSSTLGFSLENSQAKKRARLVKG